MGNKRIISCLDIKNGRVVKGVNFENLRDAGDVVETAKIYDRANCDELILLDISASNENRGIMIDLVRKVKENVSIPITVGGGIGDINDIEKILKEGADKISINTKGVKNPNLIKEAALKFGSEKITIAIDAKERNDKKGYDVYINGGKVNTKIDAVSWAREVEKLGCGEILLTSMDFDGTKKGYDLNLTKAVSEAVKIPVIASGGAGNMYHFYEALTIGKADGALAASLFHFGEIKIQDLKKYLKEKNVPVSIK